MDSDSSLSCVLVWTPSTPLAQNPEFAAISLPAGAAVTAFHGTARQSLILDEDQRLWETTVPRKAAGAASVLRPLAGLDSDPVAGMSCNEYVAFAWTKSGQAFAWGIDANEDGIIGLPDTFQSNTPVRLQALAQTKVVSIAVGKTHAAAVDGEFHTDLGRLFTWGSGEFGQLGSSSYSEHLPQPQEVESSRIFKSKQVVCGDTFTTVCTTGGYVYIFGVIGSHVQRRRGQTRHSTLLKQLLLNQAVSSRGISTPRREGHENHPYTFPDISSYFAVALTAGSGFVAILTDDCVPLIADDCMDLVKLPVRDRDQVLVLSAVDRVVYGQTDSVLYEWREPQLQANASTLLRNLVASGRYSCPLHTWAASVFKTDPRLGHVKLDPNLCGSSDVSCILADRPCLQYPLELLSTVNPKGREQFAQGLLDAKAPESQVAEPQNFSKVLLQKLKLEQGNRLNSLNALVAARLHLALKSVREYVEIKRIARKSRSAALTPTMLGNVLYKLWIARMSAGFGGVKHRAELTHLRTLKAQQEQSIARHYREEAVRSLVRVVSSAELLASRRAAERLFANFARWKQHEKRRLQALQALRRLALRTSATVQKQAIHQWSNYIILLHICGEGVDRLIASLAKHQKAEGFARMSAHLAWSERRTRVLGRLLKRQCGRAAQIETVRAFAQWKAQATRRTNHADVALLGCKALASRLKAMVSKEAYRPVFKRLRTCGEKPTQSLRAQLVCMISVLGKVRYRCVNSAFNSLLRLRSDSVLLSLSHLQAPVLCRLRFAFSQLSAHATSFKAQRAFRMGLVLSKVQDRLKRVGMRGFFTQASHNTSMGWDIDTPEEAARRTFSMGLLSRLETIGHWETLSERKKDYYCPDETPAFLSREIDFEYCSKPAELTPNESVSPHNRASLPADLKQADISISTDKQSSTSSLMTTPSKHMTTHKRPPWRAPQPTGAARTIVLATSPRSRRLQYSRDLKQRHKQNSEKKSLINPQPVLFSSKPSFSEDKKTFSVGGLSPISPKQNLRASVSTSPDSTPQASSKPDLSLVLWRLICRRVGAAFAQLQSLAPPRHKKSLTGLLGDGFKRQARRFSCETDETQSPEPSALLEESWKLRMRKIGAERVRKVVESRRSARMHAAWVCLLRCSR